MFAWLVDDKPSQIPFDGVGDLVPPVSGLSSIALIVGHVHRVRRARDQRGAHRPPEGQAEELPQGGRRGGSLIVFVMYLLGSLAISVARARLDARADVRRVAGLHRLRRRVRRPGPVQRPLRALLVIGSFAAAIAWIAGPSRSMWLVGRAGYLPKALQKVNRNDVQAPLLLLQGAIVTVLALVFVVAPNTSSAFARAAGMSVILYMGMYVFMFAAAIKLRRSQPDRERPIKIRGPSSSSPASGSWPPSRRSCSG